MKATIKLKRPITEIEADLDETPAYVMRIEEMTERRADETD